MSDIFPRTVSELSGFGEPLETPHWLRTDGSFGRRLDAVKGRRRAGDSVALLARDYDLTEAQILEMLAFGEGYDIIPLQEHEAVNR